MNIRTIPFSVAISFFACIVPSCTRSENSPAESGVTQSVEQPGDVVVPRVLPWSVHVVESSQDASSPEACKGKFADGRCFVLGQSIPIRVTYVEAAKGTLGYNAIRITLVPLDISAVEALAEGHPYKELAVAHDGKIISTFQVAGRMPDFIPLEPFGHQWSDSEMMTLVESFRR